MTRKALLACLLIAVCWLSFAPLSTAQTDTNVLSVTAPAGLILKAGSTIDVKLKLSLRAGYHVNSNMPSDKFLIPIKLTWNPGTAQAEEIVFPKPQMEKVAFPPNLISVFTGDFELVTKFKVPPTATPGPTALVGKLRYQACNNVQCLAPKTVDVAMQADVVK